MPVYLIHLSKPFHHARHYLGFTTDLKSRLFHHRNGTGSKFLAAVNKAGITWRVIRTWEDKGIEFEQKVKRCGNSTSYCPICRKKRNVKRRKKS